MQILAIAGVLLMIVGGLRKESLDGIWEGFSIICAVIMMVLFGAGNTYIMAKKQQELAMDIGD